MPLSLKTLRIATFSIVTLSIMGLLATHSIKTLSVTAFKIRTLGILGFIATMGLIHNTSFSS